MDSIRTHLFVGSSFFLQMCGDYTHTHNNSSDLQGCLRFQICRCIFFVPPPLQNKKESGAVTPWVWFGVAGFIQEPPQVLGGSSQDGA